MFTIDNTVAIVILIGFLIELIMALKSYANRHLVKDMLANFTAGIGLACSSLFMKGVALGVYTFVYSLALFRPELSIGLWIAGFLSFDFVSYAYHSLGHRTRLFWAAHVTHHSSLYFNLSVGLRVNCIHSLYRFLFWAPLCLFGIPPWMIFFFESLTTLWNVIIHTEKVKKLGLLDQVFNTPSNHRVHHASNPEYLDKNMGGILMIFDRIFGTYTPETIKPVYGITRNIHSHDLRYILLHEYREMFRGLSRIKGWKAKIRFLFSPPGSLC